MTEDIKIKISADETQAISAMKKIGQEGRNVTNELKVIGTEGKTTGKAIKDIAGMISPEFAKLGDAIEKGSEAMNGLESAGLAAKAGLIGIVATAGVSIGKMLGDWVFGTEQWNIQLEQSKKELEGINAQLVKGAQGRASAMSMEQLQAEISGTSESITRLQSQIDKSNMAFANFAGGDWFMLGENNRRKEVEQLEAMIAQQRNLRQVYMDEQKAIIQRDKLAEASARKSDELSRIKDAQTANEKALADIKSLESAQADYLFALDAEIVRLRDGEEAYLRLTLAKKGFTEETINAAIAMQKESASLKIKPDEKQQRMPGELQSEQQRFITRGPGMKGDEKLLAAAKEQAQRAAEMLKEAKKQTALLSKIPKGVTE